MLMLSDAGQVVLAVSRSDWHVSGPQKVRLGIDRFESANLQANGFSNLVLLLIADNDMQQRLKTAKDLHWSLPFGKYHAAVSGIGDALTWVRQCERKKVLRAK